MINWRLLPFVRVTFVFVLGVLLADFTSVQWPYFTFFVLLVLFSFFLFFYIFSSKKNKGNILSLLLLLIFFILGLVSYQFNQVDSPKDYFSKFWRPNAVLWGVVSERPKLRTSAKTEIDVVKICFDSSPCVSVSGKILAYFSKDDSIAIDYEAGDLIKFTSQIKETSSPGNPKSFDFKSYLRYRQILYQTFIRKECHSLIAKEQLPLLNTFAFGLRDRLLNIFSKYIDNPDQLAIVSAMILGYRNSISDDLYQAFSDSGAVHILAVSGLHVGIVASAFLFFLDKIKIKSLWGKSLKLLFLLCIIWLFALMTGAAPAVIRAAFMFSILWIGKYWFSYQNMFNVLALSALCMLLYNPYLLFQASFQFSYTAMLSLMFFHPYISRWVLVENKVGQFLWNMVAAAISAQILVFPITIFFFHKFPFYFIISGVLCVLLGIITLYVGLSVVFLEFFIPFVNIFLGKLFSWCSYVFILSVTWVKSLPLASINGLWINEFELICIYLVLFSFMFFLSLKGIKSLQIMALSFIALLIFHSQKIVANNYFLGMTVYDNFSHSVIDFFDDRHVYCVTSDSLEETDLKFICHNNRYYHGITKENIIDENTEFEAKRIKKDLGLWYIKDKVVYLLNDSINHNLILVSDFIVVSKNAFWRLDDPNEINDKTIIIERSVKKKLANKIAQDCVIANNCIFYDISKKGAFELNVK